MSRLLLPLFLLCLLLGCENTTESITAVGENDFLRGRIGERTFKLTQSPGAWLNNYYRTYNIDSVSAERDPDQYFLVIRRTDADVTELVELSLPLDPLYTLPYPIASLRGFVSFADLYDDSTLGCPHVDSSSWASVPVNFTIDGWSDDELIGQFTSLSEQVTGEGEFSIVIAK